MMASKIVPFLFDQASISEERRADLQQRLDEAKAHTQQLLNSRDAASQAERLRATQLSRQLEEKELECSRIREERQESVAKRFSKYLVLQYL